VIGILPENLIALQSINKVASTKPESSLPYLQNPAVGLYPDPSECSII
jgi:hypothetical protein